MPEGKDCFRSVWSQRPLYTCGNLAVAALPRLSLPRSDKEHLACTDCLVVACGSVLNIITAETGEVVASYETPLEDVILHVDFASVAAASRNDSSSVPGNNLECDTPEERRRLHHVAFSTRSLQLFLLSIEPDNRYVSSMQNQTALPMGRPFRCRVVKQWQASTLAVGCLRFSPLGNFIAAASTDGSVKIWSVTGKYLTHNMHCRGGMTTSVAFAADSAVMFLGSVEGYASLWDLAGKTQLAQSRPFSSAIVAASFVCTRNGTALDYSAVAIGRDRKIVVFAPNSLQEQRSVAITEHVCAALFENVPCDPTRSEDFVADCESDSELVLHVGATDGRVASYRIPIDLTKPIECTCATARNPAHAEAKEEADAERSVCSIQVTHDRIHNLKSIVVGDNSQSMLFYRTQQTDRAVRTASKVATYSLHQTIIGNLDQVLDVKAFDAARVNSATDGPPSSLSNSLDSRFARLVVANSEIVRVFSGNGCVSRQSLEGHTGIVLCCSVSSSGKFAATGSKDQSVRVWLLSTCKCCGVVPSAHRGDVTSVAIASMFDTEGGTKFIASCSTDSTLRIWQVSGSGGPQMNVTPRCGVNEAHDGAIHCVAFAPNDQLLASGGKDRAVCIWQIIGKTLQRKVALKGHRRAVNSLAFSPTDRVLASCSNDGTVRLWSLVTLTCAKVLQADRVAIVQVAFFNAGLQLVSGDASGLLRVWNVALGETVTVVEAHEDRIWALDLIERDGMPITFLTGSADGTIVATEDYTAEHVSQLQHEARETVEHQQELENALHHKDFGKAFEVALSLGHPRHLRLCVMRWKCLHPETVADEIKAIVATLSDAKLLSLLQIARDLCVNARHSGVAALLMESFLRAFTLTTLERMPAITEVLEAVWSYMQRHHVRQQGLLNQLYYVDYITRTLRDTARVPRLSVTADGSSSVSALAINEAINGLDHQTGEAPTSITLATEDKQEPSPRIEEAEVAPQRHTKTATQGTTRATKRKR